MAGRTTPPADREGGPDRRDDLVPSRRYLLTCTALGVRAVLLGVVAGLGAFSFVRRGFMPGWAAPWMALAVVLAAGAATELLAPTLKASVAVMLTAFFVGLAVHVAAWVAPLWLVDYPLAVRDVLLPQYVGRALFGAVISYPPAMVVGYLLGLVVDAYVYH